ncbi:MAG TPA: formyl transferase [Pyrinomonadaceae bacterium]|jgi:methionyl-tRNA formyltransferase
MKDSDLIVLLCQDCDATRVVYHALKTKFKNVRVITENPVSKVQMAKRRMKRIGKIAVFGQVLFVSLTVPVLRSMSKKRLAEIKRDYNFDFSPLPSDTIHVETINSDEAREHLRKLAPKVVVVNGTRIISKETLRSANAPFINMHMGITPLYRGVHGGYWALAENKNDLIGTTIHYVDEGIDTGSIIEQAYFKPGKKDNFFTYPYLHLVAGVPILLEAVANVLSGKTVEAKKRDDLPSQLRYHPTVWQYFYLLFRKGVR